MIVFLFVYMTCPRIGTICRKADCSPSVASYHRLIFDFIIQPLFIHWRVAWMENTEVDIIGITFWNKKRKKTWYAKLEDKSRHNSEQGVLVEKTVLCKIVEAVATKRRQGPIHLWGELARKKTKLDLPPECL